jgi:hypothetical protein
MAETTSTTRRTWAPTYPKLAYAEGTRCAAKGDRANSGAYLNCVKPAGHSGSHLKDIAAWALKPQAEVEAEAAAAAARTAELEAALAALRGAR